MGRTSTAPRNLWTLALARIHTMTDKKSRSGRIDVKALLAKDEEFLPALMRTALEEVLD